MKLVSKGKEVLKDISRFINPTAYTAELVKKSKADAERYARIKRELIEAEHWRYEFNHTLTTLTAAMQAMVWKKDTENRYILASPLHCQAFFNIGHEPACLDFIKGKTDDELIEIVFRQNGVQNTFGKVCGASDDYTAKVQTICHFLEAGVVDGNQVLLYVVKTPMYDKDNNYTGTLGIGWDFTEHSSFMIKMLNRWIYSKRAEPLFKDSDVFAYVLTPEVHRCDIFSHICPNPTERGCVDLNCNIKDCGPDTCPGCAGCRPDGEKSGDFLKDLRDDGGTDD